MSGAASSSELPDGSRIDREHRVVNGERVPVGSWRWVVYDPDRRPARRRINLRTKEQATAMRKALGYARRFSLGTFDPWAPSAGGVAGVALAEAVERYLAEKASTAAPATIAEDKRYLDKLALQLTAGAKVGHVEPRHVEAIVNARKRPPKDADGNRTGPGPEASPETKKRRRASLQHFFAWAIDRDLCTVNPAAGVRLPKMTARRRDQRDGGGSGGDHPRGPFGRDHVDG